MNIRTYLSQGKPLLFDGAMGTYFASLPGRAGESCERACLSCPDEVLSIHRAYLSAGCRAIKTDTFALPADLAAGDGRVPQLVEAACRLASEAVQDFDAWVFADLGPAPQDSALTPGQVYCRLADLFLEQGLTHFLVETLPSDEGVAELALHVKERCPDAFLIVSYAVAFDGFTRQGRLGKELFQTTAALPGVDAVGFNCVSGPQHLLDYIQGLDLEGVTLSVMPNAGYPTVLGRQAVFQGDPGYFGEKLALLAQAGAAIVGGCCGTTPDHIARAAKALSALPPISAQPRAPREAPPRQSAGVNRFWDKLERGERVIAVELDPPTDDDGDKFLAGVRALRDAGADAVTIADCPVGRPRADSSLLACKVHRELGVDPLPHMTCRDRNLNATKALLLGLSIEGVHNVLLITGDPVPTEDRSEVKSVFNFNSRKLARYVSSLNDQALKSPFRIFAALNLNAHNFEMQLALAVEKEECGVSGFLTQPVLSQQALDNLKLARQTLKGKILGGIYPVVSHRNACFLNNEIAGIHVCDEIISLYEGKDRQAAEELAVTISARVAQAIAPYTDGLYLMTPFQRVSLMERIISELR
jgi:homocysteine S-methyltransferase